MRVICEKGFYKFYPQQISEVVRFQKKSGYELVPCRDFFTFPLLAELPNFSFIGHEFGGLVGLANYAGRPEDVMAENGYCFYLATQTLILRAAVIDRVQYSYGPYIVANQLPQAYSFESKTKITGFSGLADLDYMRFKIERFFYD